MSIENAKVKSLFIGLEDHGLPTFMIDLDFGGGVRQGFGGINLKFENSAVNMIFTLGRIFDVKNIIDIKDKFCRTRRNDNGVIEAIGHITEDRWYQIL